MGARADRGPKAHFLRARSQKIKNSRDLEKAKTRLFPKVKLTDGGTPCPLLPPWGGQRDPKVQAAANRWLWGQLCQSLLIKKSDKKSE